MDDVSVLGCDSALLCIRFPDVLKRFTSSGLISSVLAYKSFFLFETQKEGKPFN